MKNKLATRMIFATLVIAVIALVITVNPTRDEVSAAEWNNEQVTESYFLGSEFTLPEAKLTVNNKTVDANVSLIFPDGSAKRAQKIVLDQIGTYVLKYSATVDGKPYGKEVPFVVRGDMLTYSKETTKIGYATNENTSDPSAEYLTVALAQGDTLKFSQLIDVSNITKDDTLIDLFISPTTVGIVDFDKLYYQFTDSQNPDIYLKVRLIRAGSGIGYFLAGGNDQEMKGYELLSKGNKLHVNNQFGAAFHYAAFDGLDGLLQPVNINEYDVKLRYDAPTRTTYFINGARGMTMIVDQDSTLYYESLWTGFPSGKVSLSMWAENYNSANATFCITSVRGIDISAYGKKFEETEPPVITIDTEYEDMPIAKVGGTYPVPHATAIDEYSGIVDVDVDVYYNYSSANAVNLEIVDQKFATLKNGYYSIVYTAVDRYGNKAEKVLSVRAGDEIPQITLSPLFSPLETVVVGELAQIQSEFDVAGGSGNKTISIQISNGNDVYQITDNSFRPEKAGEYTVTYTATDYVGNTREYSYTFSTTLPTKPSLIDEVVMPQVLISQQPYALPVVYANDYRTGTLVRALCEIEVTDANGTNSYNTGDTFIPSVTNNGDSVSIAFKYDGETLKTIEIPTILAWIDEEGSTRLQEQNYFYGQGFTATKSDSGVLINLTQADAEWTFANTVVYEGFSIQLTAMPDATFYSGYELTLVDATNPKNAVKMQIVKQGDVALFSVYSRDEVFEMHTDIFQQSIKLGYSADRFTANRTGLKPIKTIYDETFNGFATPKVYVKLRLIDAQEGAQYKVVSISGNVFTGKARDQIQPLVTILGDYGGSYAIGSEYTINSAVASDVLSPNVKFTMTLRSPSGNFVTDVNGTVLNNVDPTVTYKIVLEEYGQYVVTYTAEEDTSFIPRPNPYNFISGINVVDLTAPEITFDGAFKTSAKVQDVLVIPDFEVSDNLSSLENITLIKYVINPHGSMINLLDGNSIKAQHVGAYKFVIMAIDEIGNVKTVTATVTVTD